MRIEHVALWVADLDRSKAFYTEYFLGQAGAKYLNRKNGFESYFLTFESGARLEIMHKPGLLSIMADTSWVGFAHFAMTVGSKEKVDDLTEQLRTAGYEVAGEPHTTGDGYYESCIMDPDGNRVEIVA